jgi:hypothetical protein
MSGSERLCIDPGLALDLESGGLQQLAMPGCIREEPLTELTRTVEAQERSLPAPDRTRQVDLVRAQEIPVAHATYCRQGTQRVSQVEQQAATDNHVEPAVELGVQVIDAQLLKTD